MSQLQGDFATGRKVWGIDEVSNSVVSELYDYDLKAALAAGDIIEIGVLPAYATVIDAVLLSDKVDTGGSPAITLDVGIMSGAVGDTTAGRTCGNELFASSVNGQAAVVERMSKLAGFTIVPTDDHRSIGVKVVVAPATGATTGKIRVRVSYAQ